MQWRITLLGVAISTGFFVGQAEACKPVPPPTMLAGETFEQAKLRQTLRSQSLYWDAADFVVLARIGDSLLANNGASISSLETIAALKGGEPPNDLRAFTAPWACRPAPTVDTLVVAYATRAPSGYGITLLLPVAEVIDERVQIVIREAKKQGPDAAR